MPEGRLWRSDESSKPYSVYEIMNKSLKGEETFSPSRDILDYWERYYGSTTDYRIMPSQFAAFMIGEISSRRQIIDVGCGSGRDALFFAHCGHDVIGIDAAANAIEICRQKAEQADARTARFLHSRIDDDGLLQQILAQATPGLPTLVYARFFLHAITDAQEKAFFDLCSALAQDDGLVAVEFRTMRDALQHKETPDHYRRFINPLDVLSTARAHGFLLQYFVEGFGYAKYRADDAHVARCLFAHDSAAP